MLKYIRIYNELTRIMGIIKLILIGCVDPLDFSTEYAYGPYIYSKFLAEFLAESYDDEPLIDTVENYKELKKITDINELPDFCKFIMNKSGEVFTTPVGLIAHKYFYLENTKYETDNPLCQWGYSMDNVVYSENSDLFGKRIKLIFLIKKKYNLPRPITYLIILSLCELYFKKAKKYVCPSCNDVLNYDWLCNYCDYCRNCKSVLDEKYKCDECEFIFCAKCMDDKYCFSCAVV